MHCASPATLVALFATIWFASAHAYAAPVPKAPTSAAKATPLGGPSRAGGFHLGTLPMGKSVTMPRPATTIVPLGMRVMLTGTDLPQSLSFRTTVTGVGALAPIRVSIYDRNSDRVKYVNLTPGASFLYTIKDLETITVIPQTRSGDGEARHLSVVIESDKPLEVAH